MSIRQIVPALLTISLAMAPASLMAGGNSRSYSSQGSSYSQKYNLYDYNQRSSYPLSTGKRVYGYNPRDYMRPKPRIERTRQPLGYPNRSPYPYYYPYGFYYGFYPYSYYHFYNIPWYTHYNYRYYHDLYQPWYSTPYQYNYYSPY
ncbi:MAG: hypothetical protein R3C11_06365 [Planctomycetaceae bacterium]